MMSYNLRKTMATKEFVKTAEVVGKMLSVLELGNTSCIAEDTGRRTLIHLVEYKLYAQVRFFSLA